MQLLPQAEAVDTVVQLVAATVSVPEPELTVQPAEDMVASTPGRPALLLQLN